MRGPITLSRVSLVLAVLLEAGVAVGFEPVPGLQVDAVLVTHEVLVYGDVLAWLRVRNVSGSAINWPDIGLRVGECRTEADMGTRTVGDHELAAGQSYYSAVGTKACTAGTHPVALTVWNPLDADHGSGRGDYTRDS